MASGISHAQTSPEKNRVAQELVARLDQALLKTEGLVKANLILIKRSGDSWTWDMSVFRKGEDSLSLFESKGRGLEYKILFKEDGELIYAFNALSRKIFRKTDEEKYESHLSTGFSFVDLSGNSYQANYNPIVQSDLEVGGKKMKRVAMRPIVPYFYSKLVLLLEPESLKPIRLDFHDKDGVLYKTLNIKYGPIKVKAKQKVTKEDLASRLEMLDLNTGSISVLEYTEVDRDVKPDPSLFELENLNRL
ncbi:outer membrane lipoprotein-sorting protein [Leptospira fletcheri]|uniref:Outer membrane lipoprotein-sorting protein n=1 Tax=Leptospira fletcheri TaxID=2484981 RepID=A0A4R9G4G1_9LEPT|nr:outer membrane lipoprotein-sorting protein [Leptospira fletcheri]TGK06294.1 outer membrane lipoprotein-sorting protein [Leptospira fletcheri]